MMSVLKWYLALYEDVMKTKVKWYLVLPVGHPAPVEVAPSTCDSRLAPD